MKTDNKATFDLAREILAEGQDVTICVLGQSMLPFFRSGSVVRLRPVEANDLVHGHVVLGQSAPDQYVIHRIYHIGADSVTLLGDGNYNTEVIPIDKIYGIVKCGRLHLMLARIWMWMRPVRKYPLWVLRKACRK